jgi:hypothetical protein
MTRLPAGMTLDPASERALAATVAARCPLHGWTHRFRACTEVPLPEGAPVTVEDGGQLALVIR